MAEFLKSIIPVSMDIWIVFFIMPMLIAFIWQLWLCTKTKNLKSRLFPFAIPVIIGISVLIYRFVFIPLDVYFLGFIAAFLVGTSVFMLAGSIAGWIVYFILCFIKKGK